jgi:hypothetical protein
MIWSNTNLRGKKMKRLIAILVISIGFTAFADVKSIRHIDAYGYFYSHLAPHGVWMEFDDGLVVWRPTIIRRGWVPYSIGRWIWTDYGWYWDSYENFGYITYHYGRWFYDDYYGWVWIPDYDWAPAWVEWRYDDNYIGWAPLPPYAVFSINIGIYFTFNFITPYDHWHFVNYNYLCDPYVYNYYVGPKYKYRVFSNTKYRNDYAYSNGRIINRGVDIDDVKLRGGQDIRQRNLQQVSDPRELARVDGDRKRDRNTDVVRTYIPSRDEIRNDNTKDADVRKIERNSTIETSRLQLGDRNVNRKNVEIEKRKDDSRIVVKEREAQRNNGEEKRKQEIIEVEKKREETKLASERQNKEIPTSENQNRRSEIDNSRNSQNGVSQERNTQVQRQQNEVKVERKVESGNQESRNLNRTDEQTKKESSHSDEKVNQESRTSGRTRTR